MAGGTMTIRYAGLLVMLPTALDTMHRNHEPLSARVTAAVLYVAFVAPLMLTPFLCHWYESGVAPEAITVKLAAVPAIRLSCAGCTSIAGESRTLRRAALLKITPPGFVTRHL